MTWQKLLCLPETSLRNWLNLIRRMIWVPCLRQRQFWTVLTVHLYRMSSHLLNLLSEVICCWWRRKFNSPLLYLSKLYLVFIASNSDYVNLMIGFRKRSLLAESRRRCFGQNGQKMQALNLQSVWKCNFYMVWAGRGPKEELVSRLCQNTGGQIYFGQNGTTATSGRILMLLPAQSHANDEKAPPSFREDPFCTFQF